MQVTTSTAELSLTKTAVTFHSSFNHPELLLEHDDLNNFISTTMLSFNIIFAHNIGYDIKQPLISPTLHNN